MRRTCACCNPHGSSCSLCSPSKHGAQGGEGGGGGACGAGGGTGGDGGVGGLGGAGGRRSAARPVVTWTLAVASMPIMMNDTFSSALR
jgi:hypothetical protein